MSETRFDVVGIGNAIVDVLAHANDQFINENNLIKGTMSLVDEETAQSVYDKMGPGIECSGGSAANTIAAMASLGSRGAFIGKVRDDQLGTVFRHDITALGITFETEAASDGASTARCMIHVTPDAQRTMQTFLGACVSLGPDDIDEGIISAAAATYLEGYLWDPDQAKQAFRKAATVAEQAGRQVALSLSDPFCVDRHRDDFLDLVKNHVNVVFANEEEIMSLYQVENFDEALQMVRADCDIAALTRSEKGSVIVRGDEVHIVDAEPVDHVVDTTGAGDAYAAGFLHGLTTDKPLDVCARLGGIAAAEIISHVGARPDVSLSDLVEKKLN
ncbi:MAG: adenosine kinase [Rhodospirillaceae bacterium]|jgi:sugar/nucleoside kinase (ribokinase family)|nr:adenosine kinase [Rhodospirillaceae bacterium]MBT5243031.1 adenosine kinase [Rhodospirillaceae bacterium]MBT5563256.1 adenosine kinase [Rhodospirillaceae bacterium]MBT6243570.1 adenosine kinase [Rhodospirillaceae bacterium]